MPKNVFQVNSLINIISQPINIAEVDSINR